MPKLKLQPKEAEHTMDEVKTDEATPASEDQVPAVVHDHSVVGTVKEPKRPFKAKTASGTVIEYH